MNKTLKHLLVGTTMTVMAFGALATNGDTPRDAKPRHAHMSEGKHHKQMDPAKFKEKMAQRQAELREKLNLSAAQEPAWNAFVAGMTPPAAAKGQRMDRAEWDKLTAPQRMERQLQRMQQMQANMSKRLDAVKTFYDQLSPEQRAIFDENTKRGGHRHHRG